MIINYRNGVVSLAVRYYKHVYVCLRRLRFALRQHMGRNRSCISPSRGTEKYIEIIIFMHQVVH